jgi:dTDP-4-dehydrorhamnose reductase
MSRWLITGGTGMLGTDLADLLTSHGHTVTAASRADLDVTDAVAVADAVADHDIIVNAAAYTRVDDAEKDEEAATAINGTAAGSIAAATAAKGARLVHISTDYVFDGTAITPYAEDAPTNPVSAYGRSKELGERLVRAADPAAIVLRTAWLYGANGPSFVRAITSAAATRETLSVVADQVGQPTFTVDVAQRILDVVDASVPGGIYHATNSGYTNRHEFAREIFRCAGLDPSRVHAAVGEEQRRPAPRPAWSVLGHDGWKTVGLAPLRDWREALQSAHDLGVF